MTERAAHLVDHVIPNVPVRQWVLTLPHRLRYPLAWRHDLCKAVVRVPLREVHRHLRTRARERGLTDVRPVRRGAPRWCRAALRAPRPLRPWVEASAVARRILTHLDLPADVPRPALARAPPMATATPTTSLSARFRPPRRPHPRGPRARSRRRCGQATGGWGIGRRRPTPGARGLVSSSPMRVCQGGQGRIVSNRAWRIGPLLAVVGTARAPDKVTGRSIAAQQGTAILRPNRVDSCHVFLGFWRG